MPYADPEKYAAYQKAYRERNRERLLAQKREWSRANPHIRTPEEAREHYQHVDHIMPIALGGWHVLWNLAPSCRSCNTSKSDAHPMDWAERRASNRLSLVAIEKALRRHERNMRHAA